MKSTDPSSHSLNYTAERLGHDTRPTDDNGGNRHTQAIFVFEGTKDLHTKSKAVSSLSGHHNAPDDSTLLDSESTDDELSDRESHSESSSSARGNQNQNDDDDEWLPLVIAKANPQAAMISNKCLNSILSCELTKY